MDLRGGKSEEDGGGARARPGVERRGGSAGGRERDRVSKERAREGIGLAAAGGKRERREEGENGVLGGALGEGWIDGGRNREAGEGSSCHGSFVWWEE